MPLSIQAVAVKVFKLPVNVIGSVNPHYQLRQEVCVFSLV